MEFVSELTAHLENKPGRLAKVCAALAREEVNIRALSVVDTDERSVLRLVVDQLEPTRQALTSLGVEYEFRDVLAVEMDNRPGALTKILERLAEERRVPAPEVEGAVHPDAEKVRRARRRVAPHRCLVLAALQLAGCHRAQRPDAALAPNRPAILPERGDVGAHRLRPAVEDGDRHGDILAAHDFVVIGGRVDDHAGIGQRDDGAVRIVGPLPFPTRAGAVANSDSRWQVWLFRASHRAGDRRPGSSDKTLGH